MISQDMKTNISSRCFSMAHHLFFKEISPKFNEKALKHLMDKLYIFFEKVFFRFEILSTLYLKLYDEITNNEIKIANIQSKDRVLVIGSGSIPATAELIVEKTGAEVVGIDRDQHAVRRGKEYVKQHSLDERLHIRYANGSDFDVSLFDVIFISYGIHDENQLFSLMEKKMNPSARVIYRQPYDPSFTDASLPSSILRTFKVKDQVSSPSLGSILSLVLVKKSRYHSN